MTQRPDLVLHSHEIIPMSVSKFGVVLTEEEANELILDGYAVKALSRKATEPAKWYVEVHVGARLRASIDMAMLETAGRGDIVISPVPWRNGEQYGTKAYLKSVNVAEPVAELVTLISPEGTEMFSADTQTMREFLARVNDWRIRLEPRGRVLTVQQFLGEKDNVYERQHALWVENQKRTSNGGI